MAVTLQINDVSHTVREGEALRQSLNDFIRAATPFKGTKHACGEGGCGSCTVHCRTADGRQHTLTSCLALVGNLDGCAITTTEGLGSGKAGYHAVQKAFAKHHASQCGFCTPGFVMAVHGALERQRGSGGGPLSVEELKGDLDGNLCRCTGYRPIADACRELLECDLEDLCKGGCAAKCSSKEHACSQQLAQAQQGGGEGSGDASWSAPPTLKALTALLAGIKEGEEVRLVGGNTGPGVYKDWPLGGRVIALSRVPELQRLHITPEGLECGGAVTLHHLIQELRGSAGACEGTERAQQPSHEWRGAMAEHLSRIAGTHVRGLATVGGNLALARTRGLQSNLLTVLMALGAEAAVLGASGKPLWLPVAELAYGGQPLDLGRSQVVHSVRVRGIPQGLQLRAYKVGRRFYNAHALVDCAVAYVQRDPQGEAPGGKARATLSDVSIVVATPVEEGQRAGAAASTGSGQWLCKRCPKAEAALEGKGLAPQTLLRALEAVGEEVQPATTKDAPADFFSATALALCFQGLAPAFAEAGVAASSAGPLPSPADAAAAGPRAFLGLLGQRLALEPPRAPQGAHTYPPPPKEHLPVGAPVEKDRILLQASGEALYTSDLAFPGQLHAAFVASTEALARVEAIDPAPALTAEAGGLAFFSAEDVPGENRIKVFQRDSVLFAEGRVEYIGQPLGLIVAASAKTAQRAARLVQVTYSKPQELGPPLLCLEDGIAAGSFYDMPGADDSSSSGSGGGGGGGGGSGKATVSTNSEAFHLHVRLARLGDQAMAEVPQFKAAQHTIHGASYALPSQQHFYMETQVAVALPDEGGVRVHSSTQSIDAVQAATARVLALPAHAVSVECRRVGGAFGGKAARCLPVAAAAALAAQRLGAPVKLELDRDTDFALNGGRSETKTEYSVGFDGEGRIAALAVRGYFLCGGDLDLGFGDAQILGTGADQAYAIPHFSLESRLVRTNLAPRTIMRGPGFLNAVMIIEEVMERIAAHLSLDPAAVREANFLRKPPFPTAPPPPRPSLLGALLALGPPRGGRGKEGDVVRGRDVAPQGALCGKGRPTRAGEGPLQMRTALGRVFDAAAFTLPQVWAQLLRDADYAGRREAIQGFNAAHAFVKRGISISPCRFDCSPPAISAQCSIYSDGSVLVASGGIEMGQGLHTKLKQAAAQALSAVLPEELRPLPLALFRIDDTRSTQLPGGGPTWSSTGSEATCAAVVAACRQLCASLAGHVPRGGATSAEAAWKEAVGAVYAQGVGFAPASAQLTAVGFYDGTQKSFGGMAAGQIQYCSFGAACTEVEVSVLTGEHRVLRCDLVYDLAVSLNPLIDRGQMEGAFVMGLGLQTSEEVVVDPATGALLTGSTWDYKIPALNDAPQHFHLAFLEGSHNKAGILSSKASGEPSLLLSVTVLHALRMATDAASLPSPEGAAGDAAEQGEGPPGVPYRPLVAPATVPKLQAACRGFSLLGALRGALEADKRAAQAGAGPHWEVV